MHGRGKLGEPHGDGYLAGSGDQPTGHRGSAATGPRQGRRQGLGAGELPDPQGGPEHRGTASSKIFRIPVTLDPILTTPTPDPSATATPTPRPWVRGQATVAAGTAVGVYEINARCDGTNDTGKANLRIVASTTPSATPKPSTTRTVISTRAPETGGGGTAAGGPEDSSMPLGMTGLLLGAALAGGIGFAVVRRRRS